MDPVGVYYDASSASCIEADCVHYEEWLTPELATRAQSAIERIVSSDFSKYTCTPLCPSDWPGPDNGVVKGPYVLCIDQTQGDASVRLGAADAESFRRMLEDAVNDNPQATVLIKTHPDVLAGAKKGYLTQALEAIDWTGRKKPVVLTEAFAPIGLIKHCQAVYVVTSQTGFESLMAGCKTVVYGVQAAEDAGLEAGTDEYKQAVNDAIASGTIEGITGTFTFDEHHDPVKKTAILTYVDGKPELKEMF